MNYKHWLKIQITPLLTQRVNPQRLVGSQRLYADRLFGKICYESIQECFPVLLCKLNQCRHSANRNKMKLHTQMDWYKQRLSHVDQSTAPLALTSPCDKVVQVNTSVFPFVDITRTHKVPTHTFSALLIHVSSDALMWLTRRLKAATDRMNLPKLISRHSNTKSQIRSRSETL